MALLLLCSGCGDAYSLLAPEQQVVADMALYPDNMELGDEEAQVIALLRVPPPQKEVYFIEYDFGEGVTVGARMNEECQDTVSRVLTQATIGDDWPICLDVEHKPPGDTGWRDVELEMERDGVLILAVSKFLVSSPSHSLRAAPGPEDGPGSRQPADQP